MLRRQLKNLLICLCVAAGASACSSRTEPVAGAESPTGARQIGTITNDSLQEVSGIALSTRNDRFWVLNDGGWPAALHAVGADGADLGTTLVTNLENTDWEDLAAFELNGARYLLIADIGDNVGARNEVALHFVPEPNPGTATAVASRTIRFRYPDGPRDAESIAVDAREGAAYVLSKRTVPAELYRVPFAYARATTGPVVAEYLGPITSLPQPTQEDLQQAVAKQDWGWQPTAMDFSADGKSAVLLTYRAVYTYTRGEGEGWHDALQTQPGAQSLGLYFGAESVALGRDAVFVTFEGPHPAILRFPLPEHD